MPLIPGVRRKRFRTAIASVSDQSLISASDFTFLGGFKVPNIGINSINNNYGLTYRYKDGNFRLMTAAKASANNNLHLLEFSVPSLNSSVASYVNATLDTNFGSSLWSSMFFDNSGRDIYWDEPTQKLFFFNLNQYSSSATPTIGIATLDNVTPPNSSAVGLFRVSELSYKATKGMCKIPDSAAATIGGGKRLAVGFGGYESLVATGPAHLGPAMAALNPDIFDAALPGDVVSGAELFVGHPYGIHSPYTSPFRGLRDTLTWAPADGTTNWNPTGGIGYWNGGDRLDAPAIWIDTPTKKGFLVFPSLSGNGDQTTISASTFISSTASTATYDIVLAARLSEESQFARIMIRNTGNGLTAANITTISGDGLTYRIVMDNNDVYDGPGTPAPQVGGDAFYGCSYFSSVVYNSITHSYMLCYDPSDVLAKNSDPLPMVSCERFVGPRRYSIGYDTTSEPKMFGACFDETTNRLYLLQFGGLVGVYQLAS